MVTVTIPEGATHTYNDWYVRKNSEGKWEWFFMGRWMLAPNTPDPLLLIKLESNV